MGYEEDWQDVKADPRYGKLNGAQQAKIARKFAREYVRPAGKEALRGFLDQHVLKPAGVDTQTVTTGNPIVAGAVDFASQLVDDNPILGQTRRTDQKAARTAVNVAKTLANVALNKTVFPVDTTPQQTRIVPRVVPTTPEASNAAAVGRLVASPLDPTSLIPVGRGIQAAKQAAPGVSAAVASLLRGGHEAGKVAAPLVSASTALEGGLEGEPVSPEDLARSAIAGYGLGFGLGGLGAAGAHVAESLKPPVAPTPIVPRKTSITVKQAEKAAAKARLMAVTEQVRAEKAAAYGSHAGAVKAANLPPLKPGDISAQGVSPAVASLQRLDPVQTVKDVRGVGKSKPIKPLFPGQSVGPRRAIEAHRPAPQDAYPGALDIIEGLDIQGRQGAPAQAPEATATIPAAPAQPAAPEVAPLDRETFRRQWLADAHPMTGKGPGAIARDQAQIEKAGRELLHASDAKEEITPAKGISSETRTYRLPGRGVLKIRMGDDILPTHVEMLYVDPQARGGAALMALIAKAKKDIGEFHVDAENMSPQMYDLMTKNDMGVGLFKADPANMRRPWIFEHEAYDQTAGQKAPEPLAALRENPQPTAPASTPEAGVSLEGPASEGPRVSSDQMGMFGTDTLLNFMADETGSASVEGSLGLAHVQAAVQVLRGIWKRLVGGEKVKARELDRAALHATAAELRGQATVETIRAKAAERAQAIREAATTQRATASGLRPHDNPLLGVKSVQSVQPESPRSIERSGGSLFAPLEAKVASLARQVESLSNPGLKAKRQAELKDAAATLAALQAKGSEPWQLTRGEFIAARDAENPLETDGFALSQLAEMADGPPGLSVEGGKVVFRNEEGKPVGVTTLVNHDGEKMVDYTAVHPDYRRQGIATKLFQAARELGHRMGHGENVGSAGLKHKAQVAQAMSEGKPVPPEVLNDYPDLARQSAPAPTPIPEPEAPLALVTDPSAHDTPTIPAGQDADSINPDRFFNTYKMNLSERGQQLMRRLVREDVAANGWSPKQTIPHQSYVDAARKMGLDPSMLRKPGPGETITPTLHAKLKMTLKDINKDIQQREADINAKWHNASPEDLGRAQGEIASLEQDARAILDVLIPARSQDGRNLAFHRWMAESSLDEAYWIARARKLANGDPATAIHNEAAFRAVLRKGQAATERMEAITAELEARGITNHGIDPNSPDLDTHGPVGAEKESPLPDLLAEEDGYLDVNGIIHNLQEWAMTIRANRGSPTHDPLRRLKTFPSADPEVVRLVAEGRLAAAEVRAARIEIALTLRNIQRMPLPEVITTARKAGLLLSARVVQMNVTGGVANTALVGASKIAAAPVDMVLAMFNGGRRSVSSPANPMNWGRIGQASQRAATKGAREALQVLTHGMTHEQLAALDFKQELVTGNHWLNRALDATVNGAFRLAAAPDRLPRVFAIESSLREQSKLLAAHQRRSTPGLNVRTHAEAIYRQVTDSTAPKVITDADAEIIRLQAAADGDYVSLTTRTWAGEILSLVHNGPRHEVFAKYRPYFRAAVDMQAPFKQIPSAFLSQMLDYAGVSALLKGAVNLGELPRVFNEGLSVGEQRAISMAIGRAGVGWGGIMLGMMLKNNGFEISFAGATVNDAEGAYDHETKDVNEAAGRTSNSIRFKAPWMDKPRWIPAGQVPGGNLLVLGATIGHLGADWLDDFARTGFAVGKVTLDQPMAQGAKATFDAFDKEEGFGKLVGSLAGSFVPTGVADIATALDPSRQAPEVRKEFPGNVQDGIASRLPGLRSGLPRKQDALGQPIEAAGGLDAFNRFAGREDRTADNPMLAELVALNKELPEGKKVKLTKPGHTITFDKVKVEMPPEVARDYDRLVGAAVARIAERVTSAPKYQELDAEGRKEALTKYETEAKRAITDALKGKGTPSEDLRAFAKKHGPALRSAYREARAAQ